MKRFLVVAGALTFASALPALESGDPYANFHEGIYETSLTRQVPLFEAALAGTP